MPTVLYKQYKIKKDFCLSEGIDKAFTLQLLLQDANPDIRFLAARSLVTQNPPPDVVATLIKLLATDNEPLRQSIATRLDKLRHPRLIPVYREALNHQSHYVRNYAAECYGLFATAGELPAFVNLLKDAHPAVRCTAIWAIVRISKSGAIPSIINMLGDEDPQVNKYLTLSLDKIIVAL